MLNKLRGFSKSKLAGVLVAIIIIPFVFWGMGSVFSGGNKNNVAKINNETISAQDFIDHINFSRINPQIIKKNIDNNILEQLLSELISEKLVDMEIDKLNVFISEKTLANKIKTSQDFLDNNNEFSRLKYEKFLLENNTSAPEFENNLKKRELKKNLFKYIGGGIKSPYFLKNKIYINETKQIELDYFDLNNIYDTEISSFEISSFIDENIETLKEDYIDFSYAKIKPEDLIEIDEFNDEFFKKIDEIENNILNGLSINEIEKIHNINLINNKSFKPDENSDEILNQIYSNRNLNQIQLIDKNEYFLLFEISKINKILPKKTDLKFVNKVRENLILERKFELHQTLMEKIQDKKLNNDEFIKIANNQSIIENITLDGITDNKKFDSDSVKLIYSLPKNSFILITDKNNLIYLAKINNIISNNLNKKDSKIKDYIAKSNASIISDIYSSYDLSLSSKYKVSIFQNTMDRVKNYFR